MGWTFSRDPWNQLLKKEAPKERQTSLTWRNGHHHHHHHHHQEGIDRGDGYGVELAEFSDQLNIESEEKERAEGILGFLTWVNAWKYATCSKEMQENK